MEPVLRAAITYVFLLIVFRASGKRTLSEITTFDFVLLLIVGEATQQSLLGDDFSLVNAGVVIITLILMDVVLSLLQRRWPALGKVAEGTPLLIMSDGKPINKRMEKLRIDESDILEAARRLRGLERLDQVKYAVLERDGDITIIPKD